MVTLLFNGVCAVIHSLSSLSLGNSFIEELDEEGLPVHRHSTCIIGLPSACLWWIISLLHTNLLQAFPQRNMKLKLIDNTVLFLFSDCVVERL